MKSSVPLIYLIVEAWDTIGHNKMRTFLTMLGMNIGVGAIIAIISLGLMAREAIMSDVGEMGAFHGLDLPGQGCFIRSGNDLSDSPLEMVKP
jgi:putative ABC transport system permease protein